MSYKEYLAKEYSAKVSLNLNGDDDDFPIEAWNALEDDLVRAFSSFFGVIEVESAYYKDTLVNTDEDCTDA